MALRDRLGTLWDRVAPVTPDRVRRTRLVMTLLVRDEAEILARNLDFHYRRGVDFVVATDNGSVDATPEILRRYEKEGRLELLHEPRHDFRQAEWVNGMGARAVREHGADQVLHCDADEFWQATSGNLKTELLARPDLDALRVPVTNVLLRDRAGAEDFRHDAVYAVVRPYRARDLERESRTRPLYLFEHPPGLLLRARDGVLPPVRMGNHGVAKGLRVRTRAARGIRIYHVPIRSRASFRRKVQHGGQALARNDAMAPKVGFHWRRWYRAEQAGRLDPVYREHVLDAARAERLIREGRVAELPARVLERDAERERGAGLTPLTAHTTYELPPGDSEPANPRSR